MARCVLITGASGGIGEALAEGFATSGYNVVLGYHTNQEKAQALCLSLDGGGGRVLAKKADVSREEDVEALFAFAEEQFGAVDVLVNNAGIAQQKMFCDISVQEWEEMFAVHTKGCFLCCRRALLGMICNKRGSIVNIASMWGQVGASCEAHYSAAKAAVIGLTKALAKEEGPSGVRVNCVAPGAIDAGMMNAFTEQDKQMICEEIPLGKLGSAQDVAEAVLFLASGKAAFITGQVLGVNGGQVV